MSASTSHNLLGNSKEKYDHNFVNSSRFWPRYAPVRSVHPSFRLAKRSLRPSLNKCLPVWKNIREPIKKRLAKSCPTGNNMDSLTVHLLNCDCQVS
jgi:hypothetical protein